MPDTFTKIDATKLSDNAFKLIGKDWMLITAGTKASYNMMTASWGGLGVLWDKKVCFCFIRPTRHTYGFMEKADQFTLSIFPEKYRDILVKCGTQSGKTTNKMDIKELTPVELSKDSVTFEQASLVFVCKKIYFQDILPENFLDAKIEANYPDKDYHRMYIGEIVECFHDKK